MFNISCIYLKNYLFKAILSKNPLTMEQLEINNGGGQGYGFILYRKKIGQGSKLTIKGKVKDRAVASSLFISPRICTA